MPIRENISIDTYPNPASGMLSIRYQLIEKETVSIKLYDLYGKLVKIIVNGTQEAGTFTLQFDSSNLSDGIYYCRIEAGSMRDVTKITIVK